MKKLVIVFTFAVACVCAQTGMPKLAEIKIAAEAGDPAAQDELAESYIVHLDSANAEIWFRKSAAQGFAHAQGKLGNMLLMRAHMAIGIKPAAQSALGAEAVRWIALAANQGDKQGQADFASVFFEGKFARQDLVEAYKWGDLASQATGISVAAISGRSTRDAAILKMNANQIAEARQRVAAFVPHKPQKTELPEPAWIKKIKLNGITGTPDKRFAAIGSQTFEKGEKRTVKIDGQTVIIQCLEITDSSATVSIEGIEGTRTLNLNRSMEKK